MLKVLTIALLLFSNFVQADVLAEINVEQLRLHRNLLFASRNLKLYYHGFKTECVVVVTHGLFQSPKDMTGLSEELFSAGCNVIAPLLPGHWEKDIEAFYKISEIDWIEQHEKTVEWAAKLGKKISLVGHSLGGLLSFRLALLQPDRIHRLVLLAPALKLTAQTRFFSRLGSFLGIVHVDRSAKTEYAQNSKSAVAGTYVQALIDSVFVEKRSNYYQKLKVPLFVISTESDETIQHQEVVRLSNSTQGFSRFLFYPKSALVYHDNIQRSRKDLEPDDPLAWENPDFRNMSQQIIKFILE